MAERLQIAKRCCNPYKLGNHSYKSKGLRKLTTQIRDKIPSFAADAKICGPCRKKSCVVLEKVNSNISDGCSQPVSYNIGTYVYVKKYFEKDTHTHSTIYLYNIPRLWTLITKHRANHKKKLACDIEDHQAAVQVLEQIKEKYKKTTSASEKIILLTLAPKTWGRKKLACEFNASERQAKKAIQLVKENGILTSPLPKKGRILSPDVEKLILDFYNDDDNSRM
ncbi:unnamed protein product [Brassicogethes aeneus]|uniref:Uncharacterized protein n=1 Tax=Brassicogethes aeneus TaxID=1431903 RepID=A0A9P0FKJ2_BRAAE|nr:unnamed protein product [Brassicogethes aeneus]